MQRWKHRPEGSNWGDFGPDDQLGRLNLITEEQVLKGAREIRVNEETEYMVVRGMIRSKDVSADNSVLSTQIADASIEYYGKGVLADKQKPGWFSRLMDNVWPF